MTDPATPLEVVEQARAARLATVQPLRDQLDYFDRVIAEYDTALATMRAERRKLAQVLTYLDPPTEARRTEISRRGGSARRAQLNSESKDKRERMLATIQTLPDPFTVPELYAVLKERENGHLSIGMSFTRAMLEQLHADGLIVLDGIAAAGGHRYRRMGSPDE